MRFLAQVWKKGGNLRHESLFCALERRRSHPKSHTCASSPSFEPCWRHHQYANIEPISANTQLYR